VETQERTLVLVKPDAIQRGLAGEILSRLERRGLRIAALRLLRLDEGLAHQLYAVHRGKPFFDRLVEYMTSTPIVAAVFEGSRAVKTVRQAMGDTDPAQAAPGSIRGDLGMDIGRNLIHGSDSLENARREIALFFSDDQILGYERSIDRWVFE
jgi:nucleoside-diphosphate kinase